MNRTEFKLHVLDRLERLDEAEMEATANERRNADRFTELYERWQHARRAFLGMGWEEFIAVDSRRNRSPRRGRPKADSKAKADTPIFRAARDVDRIKHLWREMNSGGSRMRPPVSPIEIAAERHKVDETALGELVRRPTSRRHDRHVSRR